MSLCYTNILHDDNNKEYKQYFSELSYHKTLKTLIVCGEYNKTKKRSTPMYCYGSTITCTRFPKIFCDGKPQILPCLYYSSKPDHSGYNIIKTSWFHSLVGEIENYVLHYLHNFVEDNELVCVLATVSLHTCVCLEPSTKQMGLCRFISMNGT